MGPIGRTSYSTARPIKGEPRTPAHTAVSSLLYKDQGALRALSPPVQVQRGRAAAQAGGREVRAAVRRSVRPGVRPSALPPSGYPSVRPPAPCKPSVQVQHAHSRSNNLGTLRRRQRVAQMLAPALVNSGSEGWGVLGGDGRVASESCGRAC